MSGGQEIQIIPMTSEHITQVAQLHIEGIKGGFISSLGSKFVCYLYQAIVESDKAFGFVAVKGDKVLGFISCAENTSKVYVMVLKRNFFKLLWAYLPKILHPKNIKSAIETLFYPVRSGNDLPSAELLSVVVAQEERGLGLGRKLVEASKEEFRRRGVISFKTIVYELFPSNDFYIRAGFKAVGKYCQHGKADVHNTYVMEVGGDD